MDYKEEIAKLLKKESKLNLDFLQLIEIPPNQEMGDYALPCFTLSRELKKAPQQIAIDLSKISKPKWLERAEAKGPYLNFFISKSDFIGQIITKIQKEKNNYGSSKEGKLQKVCIDFSSPNIAKPFSVGHLRSTAIGNSIYRILSASGYKCIGINHLGDWGIQFGKMVVAYNKWLDRKLMAKDPIKEFFRLYVKFHEEAEKDPSLEDEARAWFRKMELGDKQALKLWKLFSKISLMEVKRIYKLMGVKFDAYTGESFYNRMLDPTLKMLESKGLVCESEGATVVKLEADSPPCILRTGGETSLYATRDIAAAIYRYKTYKFSKSIYVVDVRQSLHFQQFFKVLEMAGFEWAKNMVHVPFGLIKFEEGVMSTRKGNVIFLEELFAKAAELVEEKIKEKNPGLKNKKAVASQIAIGAVIFWDLSHDRIRDIEFSWNIVLDFEGETGPYIQYTYARAKSILKKAKKVPSKADFSLLSTPEEKRLAVLLGEFPAAVCDAASHYKPSIVARKVIEISQAFNEFYHKCQCLADCIDPKLRDARLMLVSSSAMVIKNGLSLLGIEAPEQM